VVPDACATSLNFGHFNKYGDCGYEKKLVSRWLEELVSILWLEVCFSSPAIHPLLPINEGEGEERLSFVEAQLLRPWNASRLHRPWAEAIVLAEENVPATDKSTKAELQINTTAKFNLSRTKKPKLGLTPFQQF